MALLVETEVKGQPLLPSSPAELQDSFSAKCVQLKRLS